MNNREQHALPVILIIIAIMIAMSCSPNPKDILVGAYNKCQSIDNGYYEMEKYFKMMSRNDTIKFVQNRYFKKLENDPVVSFVFHMNNSSPEVGEMNLLYTGEELVWYSGQNGHIIPKAGNESEVWTFCVKNPALSSYLPVTYTDSRPLPFHTMFAPEQIVVDYVKKENLNEIECYHITTSVPEEYDPSILVGYGIIVNTRIDYWISKQDSIPIQFAITRDLKIGNDTLVEFEKYRLLNYEFNTLVDNSIFTLESVPSNVNVQPVEPSPKREPLGIGEMAPNWSLLSTKGDTLSLTDYRGELLLIDFFYASCPPCVEILNDLNYLYNLYNDNGLHVVGLSSIDSQKTLEYFMAQHKINYPILLGDFYVSDKYNINVYPTTYLINREGKIVFRHEGGYDKHTLDRLEYIIKQHI